MTGLDRRAIMLGVGAGLMALPLRAQDGDGFFKRFEQRIDQRFQDAVDRDDARFERVEAIAEAALAAAEQDVGGLWATSPELSGRTRWVGYSPDRQFRVIVDYDAGTLTFQTNRDLTLSQAREQLDRFLAADSTRLDSYDPVMAWNARLAADNNDGEDDEGGDISTIPAADFAAVDAELQGIIKTPDPDRGTPIAWTRLTDGVQATLKLRDDWQQVHVRRFLPVIRGNARSFGLPPSMLMAMIQQQSGFNPRARSADHAHGLMQIRPDRPSAEAWRYLGRGEKIPLPADLFDPAVNIELGSARLHLLEQGGLGTIRRPATRHYAMVAAYHDGLETLSASFGGGVTLRDAVDYLDQMAPQQALLHLTRYLPQPSTRDHLAGFQSDRRLFLDYDRYE